MKEKIKDFLRQNWSKIIAILFLLGALADNPYGYYQFLRWAILVVGAYSAYSIHNAGKDSWAWVFGAITILFNPIIPFVFQRNTWQIIDVLVAAVFSVFLFHEYKGRN